MFLCMFGIFLCFLWGGLGSSWRISINIVGCVMKMTSVAIAGGDLGRGFFFFFPPLFVQGEGVQIQSSKMQIARK